MNIDKTEREEMKEEMNWNNLFNAIISGFIAAIFAALTLWFSHVDHDVRVAATLVIYFVVSYISWARDEILDKLDETEGK